MMSSPKMDDGVIGLLDGKGELAPVCFRFSVFFPVVLLPLAFRHCFGDQEGASNL